MPCYAVSLLMAVGAYHVDYPCFAFSLCSNTVISCEQGQQYIEPVLYISVCVVGVRCYV